MKQFEDGTIKLNVWESFYLWLFCRFVLPFMTKVLKEEMEQSLKEIEQGIDDYLQAKGG